MEDKHMDDEEKAAEAESFKNKGNEQFKKKNFSQAIDLYTQAIASKSDEPAYFTNRAIAYLKLDNFQSAMDDCKSALRIDEKFAKAYNRMSKCHIALGNLTEASFALQKSIELEPNNQVNKKDQKHLGDLKIIETLIGKAYEQGNYDKAVTNLTQLLEDCTMSVTHICQKMEALMLSYQYEAANTYSATIMKSGDHLRNNPKILCWRGKVLTYNGADALGKKHFVQALNFDPDLKEAQIIMKRTIKSARMKEEAAAVFKEQKFEEAITKFQEILELDPMNGNFNATLLLNIAICQVKLDKSSDAIVSLNQAIKYNPKYSKALVKRGEVRMAMEEYTEAIRDFSDASEYDSTGFNVQAKLKDAQAKQKKASKKDYYKILGVDKKAQLPTISKAYKKLALKWHPDKFSSATEEEKAKADKMFRELNEAKQVLCDNDKREKFDQGFDLEDINTGRADHGCGGMGGMDPNDIFSMFMGSQGGMGGMGGHPGMGRGRSSGGQSGAPPGFTFRFG